MDEPLRKAVQPYLHEYVDTFYIFFPLGYPNAQDVSLSSLDVKERSAFIGANSAYPENTRYTIDQNLVPGKGILRIFENRSGNYTEHIVATYHDWVLNMMVCRFDFEGSFEDEKIKVQENVLAATLKSASFSQRNNSFGFN